MPDMTNAPTPFSVINAVHGKEGCHWDTIRPGHEKAAWCDDPVEGTAQRPDGLRLAFCALHRDEAVKMGWVRTVGP